MKKITTLISLLFIVVNAHAQFASTMWKGTLRIDEDVPVIFDFGKDTLKLTRFANGLPIEDMTYTIKDSIITLKKTAGQSDCDNDVTGLYRFRIDGDKLSIRLISDACEDRSSVLDHTTCSRFAWPPDITPDETLLKQYAGVYAMDDGHRITITVENGRLMASSETNLPFKTALHAQSNTRFLFHFGDTYLEFVKGAQGIGKFVVYENGKTYDWKRL